MSERRGHGRARLLVVGPCALLGAVACGEDASGKHWSELATCLAGPAASLGVAERVPKLRQVMLGNPPAPAAKDAWPKRCTPYADNLYTSLDNSGKPQLLKRKLHDRFGCTDAKGSCAIAGDTALISATTELWESAKSAELALAPAANVPAPAAATPPLVDAKSWKSFAPKPLRVSGPVLTGDGRALVALKTAEGRVRPMACEFAAGFAKVRCVAGNDKVPELPPQSVEIVNDSRGLFAAGLTEKGLVAYNLETGETSAVGGRSGRLVRDGVVVEKAVKEDISGGPEDPTKPDAKAKGKAKPAPKAKPAKGKSAMLSKPAGGAAAPDEGLVAVELSNGKAGKPVKLSLTSPVGDPLTLGNQILALTPTEGGAELTVKSLSHGRLKDSPSLKGNFAGAFHTCQKGDTYAFATYAGRSGQGSAKPTGGEGKTAVTFSTYSGSGWSKPADATMPFDRAGESELVCTSSGASIAWLKGDKTSTTVGRIDCKADGCKSSDVSIPGFDSAYLWAVAPLGDKVFVLYRSSLGDTRVRVAALADLPTAKDTIVFDVGDFGGPTTGDLGVLASDTAALLLFRGEQPVALRLGPDGVVTVVSS
ncbi:MAG TPA: hypothetical protein VNN72_05305 [Polyangiaceae bacterium]|nr:hypothetical protein [Polyangiaceae bacterium]